MVTAAHWRNPDTSHSVQMNHSFGPRLKNALQNGCSVDSVPSSHLFELKRLFDCYSATENQKIFLLFSGGLDTSFLAHFFRYIIGAEIVALTVDVGSIFDRDDGKLGMIKSRSKALQIPVEILDGKDYLTDPFLLALLAEAQLFRGHHPASSLSRVAIVRAIVIYLIPFPHALVMHGSNGYQNNPYRFHFLFESFCNSFGGPVDVLTPNLDTPVSRQVAQWYLEMMDVHCESDSGRAAYSQDDNIFSLEAEEAQLSDPGYIFNVEEHCVAEEPTRRSNRREPVVVEVEFQDGIVRGFKIESEKMEYLEPLSILERANQIGLGYRIGIFDYPEARPIGVSSREVHFSPGMEILIRAHHFLKSYILDPMSNRAFEKLSVAWSELVMIGNLWTHKLRYEADALFREFNHGLSGVVRFTIGYKYIDTPSVRSELLAKETRKPLTKAELVRISSFLDTNGGGIEQENSDGLVERANQVATRIDQVVRLMYTFFDVR